ncbi:methyltransferase domain-containing protein [Methanocorpusculum labreanum]|uniref:methyltransferase domain-containing protein n=1 Tax=Methanocorpusculum labreanum TaxID=83984 RepID=UPI00315A7B29
MLFGIFYPQSVVDVGCGLGTWLSVFKNMYNCDVLGIDGYYVDKKSLYINENEFIPFNLEDRITIDVFGMREKFDLAISLEVAEHLTEARSESFVHDLTCLSDAILFSAAIPFQGGVNHINEKKILYWINLFKNEGYLPVSCIRTLFKNVQTTNELNGIEPWYANNAILYLEQSKMIDYNINPSEYEDDYSPLPFMMESLCRNRVRKDYILVPRNSLTDKISEIYCRINHK